MNYILYLCITHVAMIYSFTHFRSLFKVSDLDGTSMKSKRQAVYSLLVEKYTDGQEQCGSENSANEQQMVLS